MDCNQLLSELSEKGVQLSVDQGKLQVRAPKGALNEYLRNLLSKYRGTIIGMIDQSSVANQDIFLPNLEFRPGDRYKPFPLTEVQQAYFLGRGDAFELGKVATHVYQEYETENIDFERFMHAVNRSIEKHDMLRAVILPSGEQKILEKVPPYEIEIRDLRGKNEKQVETEIEALREAMSHQVLQTDRWPLFDIKITRLDQERMRLHISLDMLILDFSSILLLFSEWQQFYSDSGDPSPLSVTFRDYVLAKKDMEQSQVYEKSRQYWHARMDRLPEGPDLPLAKSPSSISRPKFKRRSRCLSVAQREGLKRRAAEAGLTFSGLLLASYAEILAIWSKTKHFTINLTLSNRMPIHPDIKNVIGDFSSVTLLEVNFLNGQTFMERAIKIQEQLLNDINYYHYSGIQVVRELAVRQAGTQRRYMPVIFTSALGVDKNGTDIDFDFFGKEIFSISQTPQVWLDFQVFERNGQLVINWDAVEELFPDGFLDSMFNAYQRLLEHLSRPISEWEYERTMLYPNEQCEMIKAVNQTDSPVRDTLLHTLFIEQCRKKPDRTAVVACGRTLTYAQLLNAACREAARLRENGAGPNKIVAVVMEKGWEQIVATLAVLISGAAYLPIDARIPEARLHLLLSDSTAEMVLTQPKYAQNLSWPSNVLCYTVEPCQETENDFAWPEQATQDTEDLAYIIYTSGSTGKPKGVAIDHRGAVNTILDINRRFGVTEKDAVFALSNLNFDLSVYDIFGLLAAGGAIVMPEAGKELDPGHWLEMMQQYEVTVWNSVPALMQMLVEYVEGQKKTLPTALKLVMMSGDWIPIPLHGKIKALCECEIYSLGGATEASIWSIFYPINEIDPQWRSIPYGKALSNQQFYILDASLLPCPVWVAGDLYIGGIGLAKEYWKDQEKTAASFIQNPHTGERLYRTGDLGRLLPSGDIEFLGRDDLQVKIGGHRIELGEIEYSLMQHKEIKEAVVDVFQPENGLKRLSAYVVLKTPSASSGDYDMNTDSSVPENHSDAEAILPEALEGVIMDPIERLQFKTQQYGVMTFSGAPSIALEKNAVTNELKRQYLERQSYREYSTEVISLHDFSHMLGTLSQLWMDDYPMPKYRYPSAGSLFPVQTYVAVKNNRIQGVAQGFYYYQPVEHKLVQIEAGAEIEPGIYDGINRQIFDSCGFALFFIAQMEAIQPMYGDWSKDFCLLESGYMGQLLMMTAPQFDLGLCPIGYCRFGKMRDLFHLASSQVLVHSFLGGKINAGQKRSWLLPVPTSQENWPDILNEYLSNRLPDYMVPDVYIILNKIPLTANGKINRKALPTPKMTQGGSDAAFMPPETDTEKKIAQIWSEILGVNEIGRNDNFFRLGGDSLMGVRIHNRMSEEFSADLPIRHLFELQTIGGLAKLIDKANGVCTDNPIDEDTDVQITSDIQLDLAFGNSAELHAPAQDNDIFMTGATGFLGVHVLYETLMQTKRRILCLVRAKTPEEGLLRLKTKMEECLLWRDSFEERIVPVPGNLESEKFGLSDDEFIALGSQTDSILHIAALVNHVYPYHLLRRTNVVGTREVIRLALCHTKKTIHFVSTTRLFAGTDPAHQTKRMETDPLPAVESILGGYNQSKWAAEMLLQRASAAGVPVTIYRTGLLSGHSVTGRSNLDDFFCRMLKGCIQLGKAPLSQTEDDLKIDITPVDFAGRAIVKLSRQPETEGKVFHVINPEPVRFRQIYQAIADYGFEVARLPYEEWLSAVDMIEPANVLYPYLPVFKQMRTPETIFSGVSVDFRHAQHALSDAGIICPKVDEQMIRIYMDHFIDCGYIRSDQKEN